ncbi:MAG: preprotein translocase subunit SecG [Psychromonas sp.]|nr:preprotein translocase subunit SecG [Psychromonas sp.]
MYETLIIVYLIVSVVLIVLVLIQQGKGAGMGVSFGSGASNTVFGASGAANFMTRTTAVLAILFFLISLALGNLSSQKKSAAGNFSDLSIPNANKGSAVKKDTSAVKKGTSTNKKDSSSDIPE